METLTELRHKLTGLDGRGYKAYKAIRGSYACGDLTLFVDHVQGDPFASPSRVRIRLKREATNIPIDRFSTPIRRLALADYLARRVRDAIGQGGGVRTGSGKSGLILIDAGGQEVIERTAVKVTDSWIEVRLSVGLPAAGRRILGRVAASLLCDDLPEIAAGSLVLKERALSQAERWADCIENQEAIRSELRRLGLVAFVADGAILPRESGASDRPLRKGAIPFRSPESLRVSIRIPHPPGSSIEGMGIPEGVTLIVGGGYHGKSTLLEALARSVYPHIPGDGREYVVTSSDAVVIRAEDGRSVRKVDISPFIAGLPQGTSTTAFSTEDASGSTSQAANIVEGLEAGSRLLLLDEDTSATNFMVRDARMQALVRKEDEPITPLIDRIRELYERLGVSTILVMGGSGDYFDVADSVIQMQNFLPRDVTDLAKRIAREHPTGRESERPAPLSRVTPRIPIRSSFDPSRGKRRVKIEAKGMDLILYGRHAIDLRFVEQLVDRSQTRAIGMAIHLAATRLIDGGATIPEILDRLEEAFDEHGLDILSLRGSDGGHPGDFARPRRYEIAAAINRLRTLRIAQSVG